MATYGPPQQPGPPGAPVTGDEKQSDGKEYQDIHDGRKPGDQALVPERDKGKSPTELAQRWERELQASKKELSKFHIQARKLVQKYLDEREGAAFDSSDSKFNLFWSNIEVLKSSLYAKPPNVVAVLVGVGHVDVGRLCVEA